MSGVPSKAKGFRNCRRQNNSLSTTLNVASTHTASHCSLMVEICAATIAVASSRDKGSSAQHQAQRDLAEAPIAVNQHGLAGFSAGAALRTDIVGWCQRQRAAVPERSMITCMVIGIAAQDVEHEAENNSRNVGLGSVKRCRMIVASS